MIRKYISNFAEDVPDEYYVTENQLELFNDAELVEDDVDFMEEEIENNEQGTGNMEEKEETSNTEYRISNIESQDESPEKPPTLF